VDCIGCGSGVSPMGTPVSIFDFECIVSMSDDESPTQAPDSTGNQTHQAPADESGSLDIVSKALLTRIMAVAAFAAIL